MSRLSRRERSSVSRWLLQPRDIRVLEALNIVRYLTTSQVKRAFFAECRDEQTARRRLRAAFDLGVLGRIMPLVQVGQGSPEEVHFLDEAGNELLREMEMDVLELESEGVQPLFLKHALAVSEFWVCLQLALAKEPPVTMDLFMADFEIRARQRQGDGTYRLSGGQALIVPDALVILRGVGEHAAKRRLLFIEADRGTQSVRGVIDQRKAAAYARLLQEGGYRTLGEDLRGFRVLFFTTSEARAGNVRKQLKGKPGEELFWVTDMEKLSASETVLETPIWTDSKGELRSVVKRERRAG